MFDVLVYVYEHYWRGDSCPELPLLGRKLSAAGFDPDEIQQALSWLAGLNNAAQHADLMEAMSTLEDAIRKIRVDFGISIEFPAGTFARPRRWARQGIRPFQHRDPPFR